MNYWKLLPIIFILASFSCKNKDHDISEIFKSSKGVSCKELPVDFILGVPYQIKLIDNTLIIADNFDDYSIVLYDYKNHKLLGKVLKRGQGPNEVITPLFLDASSSNNLISVLQRQTGVYTEYLLNELLDNNVNPIKTLQFENMDRFKNYRNGYILEGDYNEGSIILFDKDGNFLNSKNIYPKYINELKNDLDKYVYGQGVIGYNEKENVFAFASSFTGEVLFYNLTGNQFEIIKRYDFSINSSFKNRISNSHQNAIIQQIDIAYFSDICSSENNIYMLYSGVSMKDKRFMTYSHILKFSSQGELVESYKTDMKITNICVDNEDNKIYAIGISPQDFEYILVEINIE